MSTTEAIHVKNINPDKLLRYAPIHNITDYLQEENKYKNEEDICDESESVDSGDSKRNYKTRVIKINNYKYYYNQKTSNKIPGAFGFKYGFTLFSRGSIKDLIAQANKHEYPMFYEICHENVKLFADIECYEMTHYQMIMLFNKLLTDVFERLGIDFNSKNCTYLVDNSGKNSMHFIYNNKMVFKNNRNNDDKYSQYEFWQYVKYIILTESKYSQLCYYQLDKNDDTDNYNRQKLCVDLSVYSRNAPMRIMGSYKSTDNKRTFRPITLVRNTCSIIRKKSVVLSSRYIVNDPDAKKFYSIEIPTYIFKKTYSYNYTLVKKVIEEKTGCVVNEIDGCLIKLRNAEKIRKCIVSGREDHTDNAYVLYKNDGLYFFCHDEECRSNPLIDVKDNMIDGGYLFHKFLTYTGHNDNNNNLVFSDICIMDNTCEDNESHMIIDSESHKNIINWAKTTLVYVFNDSKDYFLIKQRDVDIKTNVTNIKWVMRECQSIYKNSKWLCSHEGGGVQYSITNSNKYTVGKFLRYAVTSGIIPTYNYHTFYPSFKKFNLPNRTFNTFSGFHLHDVEENNMDFEKSLQYKHITKNICNRNEELIEYHLNWISHLIQKPNEKPEVCLLFYSLGGGGKDLFCQFLSKIIGMHHYMVCGDLEQYVANFNSLNQNRLLVAFNEVNDKKHARNHDILKHIITAVDMRVEIKFMPAHIQKDYTRFIINTNMRDVLRLESSDRRYVMYEMNSDQIGDHKFFTSLVDEMNNVSFQKSAFDYFAKRDITSFNVRKIPNTNYRNQQKVLSMSSTDQFLKNIYECDNDDDEYDEYSRSDEKDDNEALGKSFEFLQKDLYTLYKSYCTEFGMMSKKRPTFKQDLKDMGFEYITKKFVCKSVRYINDCDNKYPRQIKGYIITKADLMTSLSNKLGFRI